MSVLSQKLLEMEAGARRTTPQALCLRRKQARLVELGLLLAVAGMALAHWDRVRLLITQLLALLRSVGGVAL